MTKRNGRLAELVKAGEVRKHRRSAKQSGKAADGKPFRTFRLKRGVRIEKATKSVG